MGWRAAPTESINALLSYAQKLGIRTIRREDGENFDFGGLQAEVFSPPVSWMTSAQPRNHDSLVLRLRYQDSTALLEGDAERVVEQRMLATHEMHADLLKGGHHGSNTSSTEELIQAVHPRWAVLSVGSHNTFARIEVLRRLNGAKVLKRTDLAGAVTFSLDGHSVSP